MGFNAVAGKDDAEISDLTKFVKEYGPSGDGTYPSAMDAARAFTSGSVPEHAVEAEVARVTKGSERFPEPPKAPAEQAAADHAAAEVMTRPGSGGEAAPPRDAGGYAAPPPQANAPPAAAEPNRLNDTYQAVAQMGAPLDTLFRPQGPGGPATTVSSTQQSLAPTTPEQAKSYTEASQAEIAAQRAHEESLREAGRVAQHNAITQAAEYGAAADFAQQRYEENQREQAAAKSEMNARMADTKRAHDAFLDANRAAPLGSMLNQNTGQKVMGAIALALGGFVQGVKGLNVNPAQQIITASIDAELAERRQRLEAGKVGVDQADDLFRQSVQRLGSIDAAQAALRATLLDATTDRVKAQEALAHGDAAAAQASILTTGLQKDAADSRLAAATGALAHVTTSQKQTFGGAGESAYAREMKRQKLLGAELDNMTKAGKLMPGTDLDPRRVQLMQRQVVNAGLDKLDAARSVLHQALAANGGHIPNEFVRALSGLGTVDRTPTNLMNLTQRLSNPREREAAAALVGFMSSGVYADSGKTINMQEFGMKLSELGFNKFSSESDVKAGIKRSEAKLKSRYTAVGAGDPAAYATYRANMQRLREQDASEAGSWSSNAPVKGSSVGP